MRSRRWVFTNYNLDLVYDDIVGLRYAAYGVERAPTTGRIHHQGWIYFQERVSMKQAARRLGCTVKKMKGTDDDNMSYCSKDGPLKEFGTKPAQGRRVDLEEYLNLVRNGEAEEKLSEVAPAMWAQYGRRGEYLRKLLQPKRKWVTDVRVWWGPAGVGKTRAAIAWLGEDYDDISVHGEFVVGYHNQDAVLLDDFEPGAIARGLFLRMMDRYQLTVNVKNSEQTWNPRKVAITSNHDPKHWYAEAAAVMRRLAQVTHLAECEWQIEGQQE